MGMQPCGVTTPQGPFTVTQHAGMGPGVGHSAGSQAGAPPAPPPPVPPQLPQPRDVTSFTQIESQVPLQQNGSFGQTQLKTPGSPQPSHGCAWQQLPVNGPTPPEPPAPPTPHFVGGGPPLPEVSTQPSWMRL